MLVEALVGEVNFEFFKFSLVSSLRVELNIFLS